MEIGETNSGFRTGTVRKTLPLEQGQLQRALTITSAGYAEPAPLARSLTITSAGYAVPVSATKPTVESSPDIIIQPLASSQQTSATAVFPIPHSETALLSGSAFGQTYEA